MKTEEGSVSVTNFFSSHDNSEEAKKVKLMYTSDFLKSFDKAPKTSPMFALEDLEEKKFNRTKDSQVEKLKDKLEMKDVQIQQLRYLLVKVKDLVMEQRDDTDLVKQLKDILVENDEGRQLLSPEPELIKKKSPRKDESPREVLKVPLLSLPLNESRSSETLTSPSSSAGSTLLSPTSPSKPSTKSPRRKGSPHELTSPSVKDQPSVSTAPSPTAKQVTVRSPRRNGTKTQTQAQPVPLSAPPGLTLPESPKNVMKRSPSMPVINNKSRQDQTQAQLKLQKKTKSQEDATVDYKGKKQREEDKKSKVGTESTSPRKGIKKSVSMSSILEGERQQNSSFKCTSLEEIVGQIYPLTKYQAGCRFLQKKLEEQPDSQHVTLVFNEVFDHLIELMTDPYGQYLVPKLMKYCDKEQRHRIVTKIAPKIVTFACHTYGIHGVQKILEFLTDDQVNTFVEVIRPTVILLAKDGKGNYLIQSFLKQFPAERNQFIYDAVTDNCVEVATHKVGCTLINRCIDYANEQQLMQLVDRIVGHALYLVQDQFGNYVVQHLLSTRAHFAPNLIKSLLGHIAELSVQKFSSNVIEKCLQVSVSGSPDLYAEIIREITDANLLELLQDRYANFVIQTALDVADDQQHAKLVKLILPYIHQIKTPYVMHIQKKILQV